MLLALARAPATLPPLQSPPRTRSQRRLRAWAAEGLAPGYRRPSGRCSRRAALTPNAAAVSGSSREDVVSSETRESDWTITTLNPSAQGHRVPESRHSPDWTKASKAASREESRTQGRGRTTWGSCDCAFQTFPNTHLQVAVRTEKRKPAPPAALRTSTQRPERFEGGADPQEDQGPESQRAFAPAAENERKAAAPSACAHAAQRRAAGNPVSDPASVTSRRPPRPPRPALALAWALAARATPRGAQDPGPPTRGTFRELGPQLPGLLLLGAIRPPPEEGHQLGREAQHGPDASRGVRSFGQ